MRLDLVVGKRRRIVPATEADEERLRTLRPGDLLPVHIRKPRNSGHHRKFFALLQFVAENHPRFARVEDVLLEVKVRLHHYREHITLDGEIVYVPKSISYDEMDEGDFTIFYNRAVEVVATDLLPGVPRHVLDAYLDRINAFA